MIDEVLYEHINTNLVLPATFKFGSADGEDPPYIVMFKVSDPERPNVLCQDQGESGDALFQFSCYTVSSAGYTIKTLDQLKIQVAQIWGEIGTTENYRIWNNETYGVTILGDGEAQTQIWGAVFELRIWWELLSSET